MAQVVDTLTGEVVDWEPPVGDDGSPFDFVLVRRPDGRYDRYLRLEHVPAELAGGVLEYEDLQRMRKGDVEAIRSIICGEPNKEYRTQDAALESLLHQVSKMRPVEPTSAPWVGPSRNQKVAKGGRNTFLAKEARGMRLDGADLCTIEESLMEINEARCQPPLPKDEVLKLAGADLKKSTRRAPTKFTLSYPQGLGNVVKDLPPQAQAVVEALVSAAERRGGDPTFTEEQIHAVLNLDENKERLATRQPPERIFQYYRRRIIDAGILREVR